MILFEEIGSLIPPEMLAKLSPPQVDEVLANVAAAARNHWIRLAEEDDSHLRFDYISGIQPVEMKPGQATVALVGEIPHLLEDGAPAQDLRDTLLGPDVPVAPFGQKGKRLAKAGHYYRAIPFRHTTPGTEEEPRGKTVGQEMGSAYSGHEAVADAKKLGKEVYGKAIKLAPTRSAPGKGTAYGGRLEAGLAPKLKAHHKTDIYAGMVKEKKKYAKADQSKYYTFRTISEAVTEGWIRGPIRARKYVEKVQQFVQQLAPKAVAALLEG